MTCSTTYNPRGPKGECGELSSEEIKERLRDQDGVVDFIEYNINRYEIIAVRHGIIVLSFYLASILFSSFLFLYLGSLWIIFIVESLKNLRRRENSLESATSNRNITYRKYAPKNSLVILGKEEIK